MDKNQFGDELGVVTHSETLFENNSPNFVLYSSGIFSSAYFSVCITIICFHT